MPEQPTTVKAVDLDALQKFTDALPELVEESKAGYKTTEFWLTILTAVLTVIDGIPVPEKYEAVVVGALTIAYALSRGLAKKGVPVVTPVLPTDPA